MTQGPVGPPFRRAFDVARTPRDARNALGIQDGGGGAPPSAEYITGSADATLTNERVLTNTATVTWDLSTPGQAKANATAGAGPFQPLDPELTALASTTSAADQVPIFTGSGTASTMTVTSAARTVLDDTSTGAMLTTLGGAPLASPTFTGDPKAPTPTAGDNDTSIATTAFVTSAIAAIPASTPSVPAPQGRLTLTSGTPVMISNPAAANPVYYTPYVGNQIGLYDGTNLVATTFAELSCSTTDTSKNPSALGASKVNDWFVWNDAGTIRLCHGPDWTNDTTRSAGTALVRVKGLWLNNAAITNACAAQRGTYVGTTYTTASSLPNYIFGALANGGVAGFFGVWNAYNRVDVASTSADTQDSWLNTLVTTWRSSDGSANMRCSFVRGLDEEPVFAQFTCPLQVASGSQGAVGVGLDTTTGYTGQTWWSYLTGSWYTGVATYNGLPGLGFHYVQAVEYNHSSTGGTYFGGDSGAPSYIQNGLTVRMRM